MNKERIPLAAIYKEDGKINIEFPNNKDIEAELMANIENVDETSGD